MAQLGRPGVAQLAEQAGRDRCAPGEHPAVAPVRVVMRRVEVRDDHGDGQRPTRAAPDQQDPPGRGPAGRSELWPRRLVMTRSMPMAATVNPWSSLTKTSGSAHSTAARSRPRQRGQRAGQQRDGERDLVEVEVDHLLQAPGEAVGGADRPGLAPSRASAGAAHRDHRDRGQQGLRDQQRGRGGEDPEERGEQRHDGLEVIAEQVEPGALMSTTGARRWASCLTYSVKMPRSQRTGRAAGSGTPR